MSYYRGVARDEFGNALYQAQVSVFTPDSTTPSTIYSDEALTFVTDNPFLTGSDGVYEFYAAPGYYDIQVSKTGFTTVLLSDQLIGSSVAHLKNASGATDTVTTATQLAINSSYGVGPFSQGYMGGFTYSLAEPEYIGNPTMEARIVAHLSISQSAVATRDYTLRIVKDFAGTPDALTYAQVTVNTGEIVNITVAAGTTLSKNDKITLTIQADTADTATAIISADMFIQGLG